MIVTEAAVLVELLDGPHTFEEIVVDQELEVSVGLPGDVRLWGLDLVAARVQMVLLVKSWEGARRANSAI